ncbi:MAG: sugar phosphate nucleotidyltransferase [Pseudomonadota bacterium]|nr:sugar phosphate nucleotidyltransferase [Pseudomonadota bacterium]
MIRYPMVVLLGGLATRIRPITNTIPKAMVIINDKPFIYWILKYYMKQHVTNFHLLLGYKGEVIEDYISSVSCFSSKVTYHYDGDSLKGTGGALLRASPNLPSKFILLYGDTLLRIKISDLITYTELHGYDNVMSILKNCNNWDKSNVSIGLNNNITYCNHSDSKLNYIDYGISIINKEHFLAYADKSIFELSEYYEHLSDENKLYGYEVKERFYEIGSFKGIEETDNFVKKNLDLFK